MMMITMLIAPLVVLIMLMISTTLPQRPAYGSQSPILRP